MLLPPRVLIVDDKEVNRIVLREILRRQGCETLEAGNGAAARALAVAYPPDLVLLDVMMPGESGFETCRQLKENPLTADIPVIFVSAVTDVASKMEGFNAGAVDYIPKPFHAVEIAARVKLHLKLARAQSELSTMQAQRLAQLAEAQREMLADPESDPEAKYFVARSSVAEAGGDFYDVLRLGGASHFYIVADVSGHGVKASFATSALKALAAQNATPLNTPVETLKAMNSVLLRILGEGSHVTAIAVCVNRSLGTAEIVTAGHPPALWLAASGEVFEVGSPGEPLGVFPSIVLHGQTVPVTPGDRIFLFTDGLIEGAGLSRGERMGQIRNKVLESAILDTRSAVEKIFASSPDNGDDATLMGIEI